MAKYKVSELDGAKLDEAVAKAEDVLYLDGAPSPAEDWGFGGPILEQEGIGLALIGGPLGWWAHYGMGSTGDLDGGSYGPTPLIAAMRCFVASKFGEEIDL